MSAKTADETETPRPQDEAETNAAAKTSRRTLALAMAAAVLSSCTRIDLRGPDGRIQVDTRRKGKYSRRGYHDDDDDD